MAALLSALRRSRGSWPSDKCSAAGFAPCSQSACCSSRLQRASGLGTTILNNTDDVYTWLDRTIVGDFFVRATMPDMATGLGGRFARRSRGELCQDARHRSPGHRAIRCSQMPASCRSSSSPSGLTDQDRLPLDLREGDPDDVRAKLPLEKWCWARSWPSASSLSPDSTSS